MAVTKKTLANLTPGRSEPNKYTKAIKDMVEEALHRAGGVDYLLEQSEKNPVAFMGLIGRLLPKDVKVDVSVDGRSLAQVLLERREQLAGMRVIDGETIEATPVGQPAAGSGEQPSVRKMRRKKSD